MSSVLYFMHLGVGKIIAPLLQKIVVEAKIFFTPHNHHRPVAKLVQVSLDILHYGIAGDIRCHGYILNKPKVPHAVFKRVIRC